MSNNSPIDDPNYDDDQENSNQWEEKILEDAPSESQWYHGRLDRAKAELRLEESKFSNCYLIRESDRKPGAYVLSFKGNTGFNHFRITALCGDYYIGGKQFESLTHIIGYYRRCNLLKGEQLQNPVPPPEPVNDKKKVISILSRNAIPDTDELSFGQGEVFIIKNDMGDGWMWATSQRDGRSGIINRAFVQELHKNPSIEVYEWYHAQITPEDTIKRLNEAGLGSWLVKPSENTKGHFTLHVYCEKQTINKFKIEYTSDHKYFIGGREFISVDDIIQRYKTEDISQGVKLANPVIRVNKLPASNKIDNEVSQRPSSGSDIYFNGGNNITLKGNLYKKCQKSKRWKNYYFVLNQTELLLYYFENPKRSKPKNLIDLNYSVLYPVNYSLFSKSNVFQLILRGLNQSDAQYYYYYLKADNQQLALNWINKLKPLCQQQNFINNRNQTQLRSLYLKIFDAKNLKQMSQPYCSICLDKVEVAKTHINKENETSWDDDFYIEDFPSEVDSLIITIYAKEIMRKYTKTYQIKININDLVPGKLDEKWYQLISTPPMYKSEKPPPSLRIKTRYNNAIIMPIHQYQALKELILAKDMETILFLSSICESLEDRADLSTALLNIHLHEKQELQLIKALLEQYIDDKSLDCMDTLFRDNSMFSSLMDLYMQSIGSGYLQEVIGPIIERVIENKEFTSSTKIELLNQDINFQNYLKGILNDTIIAIINSSSKIPVQLRYIFTCLQQKVRIKWPSNEILKTTVISCFIFLRFYCLAFTNPRKYNLIDTNLSVIILQILKSIGNFLNKLANLCEAKDGQMELINCFIVDNKQKIIQFIDSISNEIDCPQSGSGEGIDLSRNLDLIHQLCTKHTVQLHENKNKQVVNSLYAVVNTISKHKNLL